MSPAPFTEVAATFHWIFQLGCEHRFCFVYIHLDWRLHMFALNIFYYLEDRIKFFKKATPLSTVFSPKVFCFSWLALGFFLLKGF